MREPKDEEKVMSPMFPRLHVNDTEKGGPRAPPRNKMALYEQLSIPSQRISSGSASALSVPPNNGNTLIPSMPSSYGGGIERSVYPPFSNSAPSQSEKPSSHSFTGVKLSNKMTNQEWKSMNSTNDRSLNTTQHMPSIAQCNSFQLHNFSLKKLGDEKDFKVPSSAQSGTVLHCSNSQHSKDRENRLFWNLSFSMHFQNVSEQQKKGIGTIDLKARDPIRNQTEQNIKMSEACQDPVERCASVPLIQGKTSADASPSPSGEINSNKSLKRAHLSSNQECTSSSVDVFTCLHDNVLLNQNFVAMQDKIVQKENFFTESAGAISKENASKVRTETCSRLSLGDDNRTHNGIENGRENQEDKQHGSLQVREVERHDDILETSMMDSTAAYDVTPDDVVRVIGEKQFWKARRAIVNQQRVFTVQVFELHRLIKVQKSIAGSADLLLEDDIYLGKPSLKASPVKKIASDYAIEQPPLTAKPKDTSQKPYPSAEFVDGNVEEKLPLSSVNKETSKGPLNQQSNYVPHSEGILPVPISTDARPSPWCFPPPGNQWLVPVMSPSEGLVYKPCTGPCSPTAGFIAPVFGNCGPLSLTAGDGDFMNATYGISASHEQGIRILPSASPLGQAYFPLYGMPVMSTSISGSAVEHLSTFIERQSKDNRFSVGDINSTFPHRSSSNMSGQMSRAFSHYVGKFQASKESEVQGSTASSPSERPNGDALPLFPTEPSAKVSDQNAQSNDLPTRVIKVVPHNPRLATESAARIFQSIQEERKEYD